MSSTLGAAPLEVVTVPDFSGEAAGLFEARTLFFLASWLEWRATNPGPAAPALRLCCIGEPPGSVRRLAERAGAEIGVHGPVAGFWGGFANKLRGLEGGGRGRRLVLDADVLVLGAPDVSDLGGVDFAAAPAGKPQVPQALWERLYAALGVPLPPERIPSLRGRLGLTLEDVSLRYAGQGAEAAAMLPYHNSGVLFVQGDTGGLRACWEAHLHRILQLATTDPEMAPLHALMYGDQVGLATALQALRAQGRTFALLPDDLNVRLVHLRAAAVRWRDIRLFHATGFLRGLHSRDDLPARLDEYAARWSGAMAEGATRDPAAAEDAGHPRRFLHGLWDRWVRAEWERG